MNRNLLLAAIAGTIIVAAILDLWTSAELVESILFIVPLALCALQRSKRLLWGTAAVVVVLTLAAEFFGFHRSPLQHPYVTLVNRATVVACLLTLAAFIHFWMIADDRNRQQKSRLQNVFDNLNEGIIVMDMERNVVQMNQAASRLLNLPDTTLPQDVVPARFEVMAANGDPLPPDQWPSTLARNGQFFQNRDFRICSTDTGATILAQISSAPVLDMAGKTIQIILSFRDITQTKEADEERRRLAAIVDFSMDAIIGKDDSGIVTSWNAAATKLFGYNAEEMIGRSITLLLPHDRLSEEVEILARIKCGEVVDHFETVRICKDGRAINVSLSISPIRDANGSIIGASKIARDTTATKKLEQQLQQSQKMDAIGQLTGGIAHDFNNLLGIVIGNLDLLERHTALDEVAQRRLRTAHKAALRGADLTRRLLTFSSSEILSPTVIKLPHLIRNIIEMTSPAIGPDIKITTSFNDSVPPLLVDAAGLESALVNLVVNARDAMPDGGSINISTHVNNFEETYPPILAGELKMGRYASISVSDNGQGMSRETVGRAFEPFFTTKPRDKGTGLGLAMVYGFAKQSHGTVRIYSEPGFGTTVTVYLPITETALQPERQASPVVQRIPQSATVLVVDDEVDLLDIAKMFLEDLGYQTLTAVNGADALEAARQQKDLDLLVTDIIMPGGMNGVELAQNVRQIHPKIKVIYCSGFPADAFAERNMPLVDGPLLHKPYQRDEFSALARNIMTHEPISNQRKLSPGPAAPKAIYPPTQQDKRT